MAAKDVKDVHPATAKGLAAIGMKATVKALEKEQASVVFVCEGVPTVLMQHLPVICALKKVPIAVLAAAPQTLGSAAAPFRPKQKDLQATAVALLKGCRQIPRLAELCQRLEASLPPVRVPFLRTAGEVLETEAEMPSPEDFQAAVPEEFIQLEPQLKPEAFKGRAKGKGWGKSKAPKTAEPQKSSGFKRARAALQGVASQPPATEAATQQVQVEAPENETPAKAASSPAARENAEETSMTIFDFFDGMDG